jgi:hypothetical protein
MRDGSRADANKFSHRLGPSAVPTTLAKAQRSVPTRREKKNSFDHESTRMFTNQDEG